MTNATKAAPLASLLCAFVAAVLIAVSAPMIASADESRSCIPGSDKCG